MPLWVVLGAVGAGGQDLGIPYRPDPPIAIDGSLQEWDTVPLARELTSREQVVWQPEAWRSAEDLSATLRLAWRPEGLSLAAQVHDDSFRNSGSGYELFRGDHLELFLDLAPGEDPERTGFGKGQFHLGISPGDLNDARPPGAFGRADPEVYRYYPPGQTVVTATVAAQRTSTGWDLEALIPWSELGLSAPARGQAISLELAISDSDSALVQQEKLMALGPPPWAFRDRHRLLAGVLAGSDGRADHREPGPGREAVAPVRVFTALKIEPGQTAEVTFRVEQMPADLSPVLFLRGRLDYPRNAGDTEAMLLSVNGQSVGGARLVNKTVEMLSRDGSSTILLYNRRYGFRLPYASSYDEANLPFESGNAYARFASPEPRTDFALDLSGLVHLGENVLTIGHLTPDIRTPMHLSDGALTFRSSVTPAKVATRAPATERYYPGRHPPEPVSCTVLPQGQIALAVGAVSYTVSSRFSVPGGQWADGSNPHFRLHREVTARDGLVVVRDSFTNLTADSLGIIQRHEVVTREPETRYYLNGLLRPAGMTGHSHSANATSFAGSPTGGIGLVPRNDAFRIHAENYLLAGGGIGLCDRSLVIGPRASYTAEWLLAANTTGSYWDFINAVRRFLDVNFTLEGSLAFLHIFPPESERTVAELTDFFARKSAVFVSHGDPIIKVFDDGSAIFAKGTAVLDEGLYTAPRGHAAIREIYATWRQASPDIRILSYFDCFLDSHPAARERFPEARILTRDGAQATYGKDYYPLFCPTLTNSYGEAVRKTISLYLDDLGADGIFWDEVSWSMTEYHYGPPWDECSGDIDPKTHAVARLKSSVELISKPWRLQVARDILQRGSLVGNGFPSCEEMIRLRFPCFTETAQAAFAARGHLYSPLVLGDHLSETNEADAYRGMLKALDYGCVYYWYDGRLVPTHPSLTARMFPITPIELGPGYIIGRERIVTRVSGFFGWDDLAEHEVFFFGESGLPLAGPTAPSLVADGRRLSEICLWPDWSAVVVRKPAPAPTGDLDKGNP